MKSKFILLTLAITFNQASQAVPCAGVVLSGFAGVNKVKKFVKETQEIVDKAEKMSDYKRAHFCHEKIAMKKVTAQAWRCKDGTITYDQPDSTGINGYNGFCGETAASNVLHMHCGLMASPTKYCNAYTSDLTPGTRPGSLRDGLNTMFDENKPLCPKGKWEVYSSSDTPEEYIEYIRGGLIAKSTFTRKRDDKSKIQRFPFPIMIEVPPKGSKGLHWVTVVDVTGYKPGKKLTEQNKCEVMINHWGDQYKVPCSRLANWAKRSGCGAAGLVCGEYPRVKFVPKK